MLLFKTITKFSNVISYHLPNLNTNRTVNESDLRSNVHYLGSSENRA